uniref:Mytimacin-AF n=1 Tax=Lissachatina fulica TaxID=2315439 RepID=J9R1P0_LISFU|nr:mytimacin-AF precursor [Lissachatina fulica]
MGWLGTCGLLLGLTLITLIHMTTTDTNVIGECFDEWSRCHRQTRWWTKILFQSCENRCKCKVQLMGNCIKVPFKCFLWKQKRFMCECYGPISGTKPWYCGWEL